MTASDVLTGPVRHSVETDDCLKWLPSLPDDCVDLIVTSPPYVDARTYGIDFRLKGEDWVAWMVRVVQECCRVCKGLVAVVCEGRTVDRRYDCTPFLLLADLHRLGIHARKPACFFRYGIPGSGGSDWWRNDWEPVLCFARPGPLPWCDPLACGHPPKYGLGGEMSNRTTSGRRVNQWGGNDTAGASRRKNGKRQKPGRPSHVQSPLAADGVELPMPETQDGRNEWGMQGGNGMRKPDGTRRVHGKPSTVRSGEVAEREGTLPAIANPGNVIRKKYDADQVRQLFEDLTTRKIEPGDVIRCLVGGNHMGDPAAHQNEAPFPETLVEPFVRSFCPPGGIVLDPFSGSGTTGAVAIRCGRRFIGCDVRPEQVALASGRLGRVTPDLFASVAPSPPERCPGFEGGTAPPCCDRAGEYNGFGSDGPLAFCCPKGCSCHD